MAEYIKAREPNLGFGNMRMPMKDGVVDTETIFKMVDAYMAAGFNYFDTGYIYKGSEEMLKLALVERYPRESFMITTKLSMADCPTPEDMPKIFKISCERLGVDYIDTYFLHGLTKPTIEKAYQFGAFDFLRELRDKGLAKHIGFSFHGTPEQLDELLDKEPDMELVQLQINYLDWEDEKVQAKRLYEIARAHGKPISVMEPCKGGWLSGDDSEAGQILLPANPDVSVASWAFRFVAGLEGIYVILSGMGNVEQVEDNVKTFLNFKPLTEEERALTLKVVERIKAVPRIPCTQCSYCTRGCPKKLPIPLYMRHYNNLITYKVPDSSRHLYHMMIKPETMAANCIGCKSCEALCPQHIEITKYIQEVKKLLED